MLHPKVIFLLLTFFLAPVAGWIRHKRKRLNEKKIKTDDLAEVLKARSHLDVTEEINSKYNVGKEIFYEMADPKTPFRSLSNFPAVGTAIVALSICFRCAAQTPDSMTDANRYYFKKDSAEIGLGKYYMGREIAGLGTRVKFGKGKRPCRRDFGRQLFRDLRLVCDSLPLTASMTVGDIGCGQSPESKYLASNVAVGQMYVQDIQPAVIAGLRLTFFMKNKHSFHIVMGTPTSVNIPDNTLDLAFMADVYHELEFPVEMLKSIKRALKCGATLAILEYKTTVPDECIGKLHRMDVEQAKKELLANGFALSKVIPFSFQNLLLFKSL